MEQLIVDIRAGEATAKKRWTEVSAIVDKESASLDRLTHARSMASGALASLAADVATLHEHKAALAFEGNEEVLTQRDRFLDFAEAARERFQTALQTLDTRIKAAVEEKRIEDLRAYARKTKDALDFLAAKFEAEAPKAAAVLAELAQDAELALKLWGDAFEEARANPDVEELKITIPGGLFDPQHQIERLARLFLKDKELKDKPPVYRSTPFFANPHIGTSGYSEQARADAIAQRQRGEAA